MATSGIDLKDNDTTITAKNGSHWYTATLFPGMEYAPRGGAGNVRKMLTKIHTGGYIMIGIAKKHPNYNSTNSSDWYYKHNNTVFYAGQEYLGVHIDGGDERGRKESTDRVTLAGMTIATTVDLSTGEITWTDTKDDK